MTELVCIICPKGCRLTVDDSLHVSGHFCPRGEIYGRGEASHPVRVITSTVRVAEGIHRRCPVKTNKEIPKEMIVKAVELLDEVCIRAPVDIGQIIIQNVLGTGADFIATRRIGAACEERENEKAYPFIGSRNHQFESDFI